MFERQPSLISYGLPGKATKQTKREVGKMRKFLRRAISSIFILAAILGLLLLTNIIGAGFRARIVMNTNKCVNNMRMIENAKEQLVKETGLPSGISVSENDIAKYFENDAIPTCPSSKKNYKCGKTGESPSCPVHGSPENTIYPMDSLPWILRRR